MKKIITILMILLLLAGCGNNNSDSPATKANPFGNEVFTKEDIQKKLDEGLSNSWQNYQLKTSLNYRESLPENVLESLKNGLGEYRYDSLPEPDFHDAWTTKLSYSEEYDILHAIFDLYSVTPESIVSSLTISERELNTLVSNNPKLDLSQYKTYEDGLDYWPYGSSMGYEVLAQNEMVKIESVRDIVVNRYEDIARYVKVTNICNHPIYINPYFIDKNTNQRITDEINWPSIDGYEAEYDKIDELTNDTTVLATCGKNILAPSEETYIGITYNKHYNFNSHWYIKVYEITEEEYSDFNNVEYKQSIDKEVEAGERNKTEDIVLIMKNRTIENEDYEYATIKGILYNKDGQPLSYMPFVLTYVDVFNKEIGNRVENTQFLTNFDGSFEFKLPVVLYRTDNTYARYTIWVNGEKAILDGKFCDVVIDDRYSLEGEEQDEPYSEAVKRNGRRYGQQTFIGQITEAKEYECTIVVPDACDYLVYNIENEEDYGGQANYYDYGSGVLATVKFHDDEADANKTAYLNVFDTDGNLLFRKHLGVQNTPIEVSDDGKYIATAITPTSRIKGNEAVTEDSVAAAPDSITTIFDIDGNVVFEYEPHSFNRVIRISHDDKLIGMEVEQNTFGIMDIETKEILWKDYRGNQIRQIIFSEDDSVVYMGSEEKIIAYKVSDGTKLWETMIFHFPIDMIASSKYIYASSKTTGGNDNKLVCIDRQTGKMVWSYQVGSRGTKLTISPDETLLYWGNDTGARDLCSLMIDANTGEPLYTLGGCNQAAWFTSDSRYVVAKGYGLVEVFDRNGNKVATSAVGSNARMSWFVYVQDDLSTILDIAGGGGMGNSGWLYILKLKDGYDKEFIDKQWEARQ